MPRLLDEEGRLLGVVNVVDATALLVIVAFILGGVALLATTPPDAVATVEFETTGQPYVLDAINESGDPVDDDVRWTGDARPHARFVLDDRVDGLQERLTAARFDAGVAVVNRSGDLYFRGDRLYVGRDASFDLGTTVVDVTVVDVGEVSEDA